MFDNPLYGSMGKASSAWSKEQECQRKDHLTTSDVFAFPKASDVDATRPPAPAPRIRSFTCTEKPKPSASGAPLPPTICKKPVMTSRSEGGIGPGSNRPPLPAKSRTSQSEPPTNKPRDYRDSSELPCNKPRQPARPSQPSPKESKIYFSIMEVTFSQASLGLILAAKSWLF